MWSKRASRSAGSTVLTTAFIVTPFLKIIRFRRRALFPS
jgi:hypothetical protein